MASRTSKLIGRIINLDGVEVNVLRRTETIDSDGDVTYSYPNTIRLTAHINELTGYRLFWQTLGIQEDADYLLTFKPDAKVDIGDLIEFDSEQVEVTNKINRKTKDKIDYIECLCRKRK